MSNTVYIRGARRELAGALHEFGREFRHAVATFDNMVTGATRREPVYESRMVVTAPDGTRYVGPWERMERAS